MINKQGIWFLTLFSLILVLSIYYITMPNELLSTNNSTIKTNNDKSSNSDNSGTEEVNSLKKEDNYITSLKIELDEKREEKIRDLEETINTSKDAKEKSKAYDTIKSITNYKGLEDDISDSISKNMKLDSYVEVSDTSVSLVLQKKEHDVALANKVMRLVQEKFNEPMNITVKFCD